MGSITVEPNVGVIIDGMKVTFPKNTGSADKTYTVHYEEDGNPKAATNVTVKTGNCGCIDESNVVFAANTLLITNITVTGIKSLPKIYLSMNYDVLSPDSAHWVNISNYTTFNQTAGKSTLKSEIRWNEDLGIHVTTASAPAIKVIQVGCDPVIKQLNNLLLGPKLSLRIDLEYAERQINVWFVELSDNTVQPIDYNKYFDYIRPMIPYYETKNKFLKTYYARLNINNKTKEHALVIKDELNNYYPVTPDNIDINFIDNNSCLIVKNAKIIGTQRGNEITASQEKWIELTDGSKEMILVHLEYNHPHDGEPIDDGDNNSQIY